MSKPDMKAQAQQIWTMLDEMAANNPQAYRSFIDKHMKEGKEAMKPPAPHMCVKTSFLGTSGQETGEKLFINLMEWQTVKAPESDDSPIPVIGGNLYSTKDDKESHKTLCIVFHPSVLKDFGLDCPNILEREMLINLALDYIHDQYKLDVSRKYKVLPKDTLCKGQVIKAQESVTNKFYKQGSPFEEDLGELEDALGPFATGCKDSLLHEMANISMTASNYDQSSVSERPTVGAMPEIKISSDAHVKQRENLIQEMPSVDTAASSICEPVYSMDTKVFNNGKQRKFVIKIHLPEVKSVSECDLTLSQSDVELEVPSLYALKIRLSENVDDSEAQAKFSKRSSTLTLTLPIIL